MLGNWRNWSLHFSLNYIHGIYDVIILNHFYYLRAFFCSLSYYFFICFPDSTAVFFPYIKKHDSIFSRAFTNFFIRPSLIYSEEKKMILSYGIKAALTYKSSKTSMPERISLTMHLRKYGTSTRHIYHCHS